MRVDKRNVRFVNSKDSDLENLRSLLKGHEGNWMSLQKIMLNSLKFSSLFDQTSHGVLVSLAAVSPVNPDIERSSVAYAEGIASKGDLEQMRRRSLDDEIRRMQEFDAVIDRHRQDRESRGTRTRRMIAHLEKQGTEERAARVIQRQFKR